MGKIRYICFGLIIALFAACQSDALPTLIPSPAPDCGEFLIPDGTKLRCEPITATTLAIHTDTKQVTISLKNAAITLNGTLYAIENISEIQIVNITGTAVVGLDENTRILSPGMMVILSPASATTFDSLSETQTYQTAGAATTPESTPIPDAISDENNDECQPRDDWTGTYSVRSGDTLTRIAGRFGITLISFIQGNCIETPDRLRAGQILSVPSLPTQTPDGIVRVPTATPTRPVVAFRADRPTLAADECTTLRWDVFDARTVFLDDVEVAPNDVQRICPTADTAYILRIIYRDDSETERTVRVTIE